MRFAWRVCALGVLVTAAGISCSDKGDNGGSDRTLISSTAGKALSTLQGSAASLGQTTVSDPEEQISSYLTALKGVAQSFPDAGGDDRKSKNTLTYAGLSLTTLNSAQAVGGVALTGPYTSESAVIEELLKYADQEGIKDFKPDELTEEASRLLELLGEITILGDKALTDQIVPKDSPLRANWDKDGNGKFEVPLPPAGLPGGTSAWQEFTKDLTFEMDRGSPIGRILLEVSLTAQKLQLRLS